MTRRQLPASAVSPGSVATVLVVGDRALFTDSLEISLRAAAFDVQRVPTLCPVAALTALNLRPHPRIALIDMDLVPMSDRGELIEQLARVGDAVVVLTESVARSQWGGFVRRGAQCVIAKSAPLPELLSKLSVLSQGRPVMTREQRAELIEWWRRESEDVDVLRDRFRRLTPREQQVLADLTRGRGIHDIAVADVVSEATVRTQVKSILRKLEVPSQLGAVALAHRIHWKHASV